MNDSLQSRLAYEAKCIEHDVSSRSTHALLIEASYAIAQVLQERDDYRAALRTVADESGAKICALEAEIKRLLSSSDQGAKR